MAMSLPIYSRARTQKSRHRNRRLRPWERARARVSRAICGQIDYEQASVATEDSVASGGYEHRCVVAGKPPVAPAMSDQGYELRASLGATDSAIGGLPWRPQRLTHAQMEEAHRVRHTHMMIFIGMLLAFLGAAAWLAFAVEMHLVG